MSGGRRIRIRKTGGTEVLELEPFELPPLPPGVVQLRIEAAGVNFIEIYQRSGLYPLPLPFTPGSEGGGVVEAVGEGVTDFAPGDRVASTRVPGSYASHALIPAGDLVLLPEGVDTRSGAAALLQGMTAHYLVHDTFPLQEGDTALIHAGGGGVGGLLIQMARARGARVLATASTRKVEIAREAGAHEVIDYTAEDFLPRVMELTGGEGVEVVYDSVGVDTFDRSLDALRPSGMLVMYGQSSGKVPPFDILRLSRRNLFLARPSLGPHVAGTEALRKRAGAVLEGVAAGTLRLRIDREFPLEEAGAAHQHLEGRGSTGKLLLIP